MSNIIKEIKEHQQAIIKLSTSVVTRSQIADSISLISQTFTEGNKVLFCGNGGSAADAEHLAAELSGRYKMDRNPLFAEALHVNSAALTAISNDFSFDHVFARLLKSKAKSGDVLYAMSTSGASKNILNCIKAAQEIGVKTIFITGDASDSDAGSDIHIKLPSIDTPRIQEMMMLIGHIICGAVEKKLFS